MPITKSERAQIARARSLGKHRHRKQEWSFLPINEQRSCRHCYTLIPAGWRAWVGKRGVYCSAPCRDKGPKWGGNGSYRHYLTSDDWHARRRAYATTHPAICHDCGHHGNLDLHHLTYARVGAELDSDLRWLCRQCHDVVHSKPRSRRQIAAEPRPARAKRRPGRQTSGRRKVQAAGVPETTGVTPKRGGQQGGPKSARRAVTKG